MPQSESQTKHIDGFTYEVMFLDPFDSTDLFADVASIIGPALGALAPIATAAARKGAEAVPTEPSSDLAIEKAIGEFFQRFTKAQQRDAINALAKVTLVAIGDAKPQLSSVFREHFKGRTLSLYKWLGFALRVQYHDFFTKSSGGIAAAVQKMVPGLFNSPST